jgi:hypothetical protein
MREKQLNRGDWNLGIVRIYNWILDDENKRIRSAKINKQYEMI